MLLRQQCNCNNKTFSVLMINSLARVDNKLYRDLCDYMAIETISLTNMLEFAITMKGNGSNSLSNRHRVRHSNFICLFANYKIHAQCRILQSLKSLKFYVYLERKYIFLYFLRHAMRIKYEIFLLTFLQLFSC